MLEALFSSRVRIQLLSIFILQPDAALHALPLTRRIGAQYSAVWKELRNLEEAGFLTSESSARMKQYRLNTLFPILPELRSIILKTVGFGDVLRKKLAGFAGTEAAFVYGSFASGEVDGSSDVDLMLIGDSDQTRLALVMSQLEKDIAREVNYIVYSRQEWEDKLRAQDPFIVNVLSEPKIMLIGTEDGLRT